MRFCFDLQHANLLLILFADAGPADPRIRPTLLVRVCVPLKLELDKPPFKPFMLVRLFANAYRGVLYFEVGRRHDSLLAHFHSMSSDFMLG